MVAVAACAARGPVPGVRDPSMRGWATRVAAAITARDAAAAVSELAPEASLTVIGDPDGVQRGRAAVRADVERVLAAFPDARLAVGRSWEHDHHAVVEGVWTAPGAGVGVAGAVVIERDAAGRITVLRLYVDLVTVIGQLDRDRLPAGVEVRGLEPPPATAQIMATGSATESRNLAVANAVWDAMNAHDATAALASAAPSYRYVDYAAPRVLDRDGTRAMVAGFLGAVQDFVIVERPVQFAAGDFVVTELVEHARLGDRPLVLHGLDIKRFAAGQVVEEWQYSNYVEVLSQVSDFVAPALRR
jgi:hypothetical protein